VSRTNVDLKVAYLGETVLKRREFLMATITVIGGTALTACSSAANQGSSSSSSSKQYTIALILPIQGVPFYNMVQKGVEAEAKVKGATVQVSGPQQWDPNQQSQVVDAVIAKKVDAIIISPCDNQVLIAPLKRANDAGIKIITVDTFIGDGDYTRGDVTFPIAYIGSDNVKGGQIAGEALIKAIGGNGQVYIQNNAPGASTSIQRSQGFRQAIAATNGAVTVVAENFDGGDISKATAQTSAILQRYPNLVGIFGATAYSAEGAAAAVKNAHKSGIIKVAHFDSSQQAIIDLRNGIVDLVIGQLPSQMGKIAVDYAISALNGDTSGLQKHVSTSFVVIDKTNVDTPQAQAAIYQ
jgi:ribose transport system substrate-binding protein